MTQENSNPADGKAKRRRSPQHWNWLQERVPTTTPLDQWIDLELAALEKDFEELITEGSLSRSLQRSR